MGSFYHTFASSYEIKEGVSLTFPTLEEILEGVGYEKYMYYINALLLRKYDIADILLNKHGIWYEDVSDVEAMLFTQDWREALSFFTNIEYWTIMVNSEGEKQITNKKPEEEFAESIILEFEDLNQIKKIIKQTHGIKQEKHILEYTDSLEYIKKDYIKKMARDRELKKRVGEIKEDKSFLDLAEKVAWSKYIPGITVLNVKKLTVPQIKRGFKEIQIQSDFEAIKNAIYNGKIDPEKIDLNKYFWG